MEIKTTNEEMNAGAAANTGPILFVAFKRRPIFCQDVTPQEFADALDVEKGRIPTLLIHLIVLVKPQATMSRGDIYHA